MRLYECPRCGKQKFGKDYPNCGYCDIGMAQVYSLGKYALTAVREAEEPKKAIPAEVVNVN